jgi:hypothetical protein
MSKFFCGSKFDIQNSIFIISRCLWNWLISKDRGKGMLPVFVEPMLPPRQSRELSQWISLAGEPCPVEMRGTDSEALVSNLRAHAGVMGIFRLAA